MKNQLQKRLDELKSEYETGKSQQAERESQLMNLQKTLLRIEGAIQVLQETLTDSDETAPTEGLVEVVR